ncbi:MAG: insulinase family protein [Planctomycetia bacterium]|nr:insulinase family protein [Planctomycetia bacterium]
MSPWRCPVAFLRERLDNGLEVIAETTESALSTSVGFFVMTGARDERDDLWGVSHFLEHMVFKGTADLSGDDINRRFDAMGASANAFTGEEDTVYYAAVLPRQQHEAVDLLARMMRPALREEDFTTEKLVILEEIRMYDDQPPFGADDRCRASFFGRHPLGRSVLGSTESIRALPVEAMRDYHRRRYGPGTVVLAASGAVDFPALVESARRLCGDWEPMPAGDRRVPGVPRAPADGGVERIVRPSAALAYAVRMAAGPAEPDPDRYAAKLRPGVVALPHLPLGGRHPADRRIADARRRAAGAFRVGPGRPGGHRAGRPRCRGRSASLTGARSPQRPASISPSIASAMLLPTRMKNRPSPK